jgi:NYN domain
MAVHGTRRGESVSWDYEGLLQLLSGLARERSGLPVLRCYWYEATVDGRRTAEQDALADVPGIKLRVAKIRPGRREGVETEIHRDLTTLARNNAISDALVVSAEEDLAQVIADVQDLGMRVTLVHIAVDGNWTISRALRQESDDIIEISGDHLRPYVELIAGAEPAHADEEGDLAAARPLANGHSTAPAASYQVPAASGSHAPPSIYTAPVVAEYQRPALQLPRPAQREDRARDDRTRDDRARDDRTRDTRDDRARDDRARDDRTRDTRDDRAREDRTVPPPVNGDASATRQDIPQRQDVPQRQDMAPRQDIPVRPDIYAAPTTSTRNRPEPAPQNPVARARAAETRAETRAAETRAAEDPAAYAPGAGQVPQSAPDTAPEPTTQAAPGQLRRLPSSRSAASQVQPGPMGVASGQHVAPNQGHVAPGQGHVAPGQGHVAPGQGHIPQVPGQSSGRSSPFSGPQPVASPAIPPGYQNAPSAPSAPNAIGGVSLSEAVQAAHEEGQEFGGSVARDAPALWLEAVLARKPRMPSDLEARLLQGSALPIDFLLHDEVRHALRRGFWDALERTRR